MRNLAFGDLTRTVESCSQETWLLTIGVMCPLDLFLRVGDCGWEVEMQKHGVTIKIGNSISVILLKPLITFKKGHQCLLKLYVHLGWGFPVWWEKILCYELHEGSSVQALTYEVCDRTCTPLHSLKTLEMANKSTPWLKKLQGVRQIVRLKQQRFLSVTFFKTQRSWEKIMCICYFIGSVVKIVLCLYFLHTKKNEDGTVVFLTSLSS